jgi:hypothetical protein
MDQVPPNGGFGPFYGWSYYATGVGATEMEALRDLLCKVRASGFVVDRKTEARIISAHGPFMCDELFGPEPLVDPSSLASEDSHIEGDRDSAPSSFQTDSDDHTDETCLTIVLSFGWNAREDEEDRLRWGRPAVVTWRRHEGQGRSWLGWAMERPIRQMRGFWKWLFGLIVVAFLTCALSPHVLLAQTATEGQSTPVSWKDWLGATFNERIGIAEKLGEDGARKYAAAQDWKPLFDGRGRMLQYGPDQVYRNPRDGHVILVEAKGGRAAVNEGYGYSQDSPEWAVRACEKVLRSNNASPSERRAAEAVVQAACDGKLDVCVIRTAHTRGKPEAPVLERFTSCTRRATRLATIVRQDLAVFQAAPKATGSSSTEGTRGVEKALAGVKSESQLGRSARRVGRLNLPLAAGIDAASRGYQAYQVEKAFKDGEIDANKRRREHVRNAAGCVGGWAGAYAGSEAGAWLGGAVGTAICPGIGTAIGGVVGGAFGAVGGYFFGEKVAEAAVEKAM